MGKVQKLAVASRPIPSVDEFAKLTSEAQQKVYRAAARSLRTGMAPRPDARRQLLADYREAAGWTESYAVSLENESI